MNATMPPARDLVASHRLATGLLVEACERALFDLRCSLGRTACADEVRVGLLAANLLSDVLESWREAGDALNEPGEVYPQLLLAVHGG
jgi:hypothetical protein